MNKNVSRTVGRVLLGLGLMLVLGSQACEDRKGTEQLAPGKTMESAAPAPAVDRSVAERSDSSPSGDSAGTAGGEAPPAGSSR